MLNNKRGYSLVELTVVVLIMAILAAVALPYYRAAVERGRIITNMNLLKALSDAVIQYYPQNNAFPTKLSQLHVGVSKQDWTYGQMGATKKDDICSIVLYTSSTDAANGNARISLFCKEKGFTTSIDYTIDFYFKINSSGLAPGAQVFTVTSSDSGRISLFNRTASSAGWKKTADNVYSIN
jgi:prepilin-type N-terminal cleavage/methylation domain-containing protein